MYYLDCKLLEFHISGVEYAMINDVSMTSDHIPCTYATVLIIFYVEVTIDYVFVYIYKNDDLIKSLKVHHMCARRYSKHETFRLSQNATYRKWNFLEG